MQTCFTKERRRRNAMQCELVTWEKHRGRIFFFLVTMQRKDFFSFSVCIFYNATFFFLSVHICYNANLLHGRRKRSTLTFSFFATTKKKKVLFFLLHVFLAFFFCYNISFLCGMQLPCYME